MPSSRAQWSLIAFVAVMGTTALAVSERENVFGYGIWSHQNAVVVFAQVQPCPPRELPPPGAAQLFISKDGGARWERSGTPLDGSEFEYVRHAESRLWIVGEHTAEGPASDSFVLVPDTKSLSWTRHVIYGGAGELHGIALSENGDFVAWIRHLKLHDNGWEGPLFIHKSSDDGQTWRVVGQTRKAPKGPGNGFERITRETLRWRVINKDDGGSVVEQRSEKDSVWRPVLGFPHQVCGQ
jgi:hypothetical protein